MAAPAKKKQPGAGAATAAAAKKKGSAAPAGKKKKQPAAGAATADEEEVPAASPAAPIQKTATELGIRDRRLANVVAGALGAGGTQAAQQAADDLAGLSVVERVAGAVDAGTAAVVGRGGDDGGGFSASKKGKARLIIGGVDVLGKLNARGIAGRVFNDGLSASIGSESRIFAAASADAFTDGSARLRRARAALVLPLLAPTSPGDDDLPVDAPEGAAHPSTSRYPSKFANLSADLAAQLGFRGTVVPAALAAPSQRAPLTSFAAACQGTAASVLAGAASDAVAHRARSHFSTCEGGLPIRGAPASLCTVCQGVARYTCTRCLGLHGTFCSVECLATHRAARCLKHVV